MGDGQGKDSQVGQLNPRDPKEPEAGAPRPHIRDEPAGVDEVLAVDHPVKVPVGQNSPADARDKKRKRKKLIKLLLRGLEVLVGLAAIIATFVVARQSKLMRESNDLLAAAMLAQRQNDAARLAVTSIQPYIPNDWARDRVATITITNIGQGTARNVRTALRLEFLPSGTQLKHIGGADANKSLPYTLQPGAAEIVKAEAPLDALNYGEGIQDGRADLLWRGFVQYTDQFGEFKLFYICYRWRGEWIDECESRYGPGEWAKERALEH